MPRMHADRAMLHHPGEVFASLETGGMCISQDGEYVEIGEVRKDPLSVEFVDVNQGDSGYRTISSEEIGEEGLEMNENSQEESAEELIAGIRRELQNKNKRKRKAARTLRLADLKMAA